MQEGGGSSKEWGAENYQNCGFRPGKDRRRRQVDRQGLDRWMGWGRWRASPASLGMFGCVSKKVVVRGEDERLLVPEEEGRE